LRRGPAAMVGLSFALSGYLLSKSDNVAYVAAATQVPWALAAAEHLARKPAPRAAALLALAMASVLWAGDPQALLLASVATVAVVLVRAPARRTFTWLAAAAGLAGLLVAPVVWPAL